MHVGCGHRRNHPCQVSSQSVQQFRFPKGSKFTISHRLGQWLLQLCYAITCYTVISTMYRYLQQRNHLCSEIKLILSETESFFFLVMNHTYYKSTRYTPLKKLLPVVDFGRSWTTVFFTKLCLFLGNCYHIRTFFSNGVSGATVRINCD